MATPDESCSTAAVVLPMASFCFPMLLVRVPSREAAKSSALLEITPMFSEPSRHFSDMLSDETVRTSEKLSSSLAVALMVFSVLDS